jgi:hypothetical protein
MDEPGRRDLVKPDVHPTGTMMAGVVADDFVRTNY